MAGGEHTSGSGGGSRSARLDAICDELADLQARRNAIDGRVVELVAQLDRERLWGDSSARSLEHWVSWRLGASPTRARDVAAVARRIDELPTCVEGLTAGRLTQDQVAEVARRAPAHTDAHFAELAEVATVSQLRTAVRLATPPEPERPPSPVEAACNQEVATGTDDESWWLRVRLPQVEGAVADAALRSHRDALVAQWRADHGERDEADPAAPPFPTLVDAFIRMTEHSLDVAAAERPHGHRTTVVLHVDAESKAASLHLGPALPEAERRYLACDATFETWVCRDGVPIGAGRTTRHLSRRLRRALEHRSPTCQIPGCDASRGLHAHHIVHWEDGGPTELANLAHLCPFHHRRHHQGLLAVSGTGTALEVRDHRGRLLGTTLARPPTHPGTRPQGSDPPPRCGTYVPPLGERAQWRFYQPPPPSPKRRDRHG